MAATEKGEGALLWHVFYPEGNSRRITNDPSNYPSNYISISLTADSRTLVVSRFEQRTNLWTAPAGDPGQIEQITFGGNHRYLRVAWTPDGTLLMAHNGLLHAWRAGGEDWTPIADLGAMGLRNVTRLAVSPKGDRIAIVAVPE